MVNCSPPNARTSFKAFFVHVRAAINGYDDGSVVGAAKAGAATILFYPCCVFPALGAKIGGFFNNTATVVGLVIGGILTIPVAAAVIVPSALGGVGGALFGLGRTLFSRKDDDSKDDEQN